MFFGTYHHVKDNKNRIRVPSQFSKELGSTYMIGVSVLGGGVLSIYPKEEFENLARQQISSPYDQTAELAKNRFFGSYFEVSEDGQGRLQLNDGIKKMVDLGKDIVSVGAQTHINIMSEETYDRLMNAMSYETALSVLDEEYKKSANK